MAAKSGLLKILLKFGIYIFAGLAGIRRRHLQVVHRPAKVGMMLEAIAGSWFGFWTVAVAIVLVDSATLLAPGEFAFAFDRNGTPRLRIPTAPFLIRQKDLLIPVFGYFAKPFFVSSIGAPDNLDEPRLAELRATAARCQAMCAYSYVTAAALVVVGPLASLNFGIGLALLGILPILYLTAVLALMAIFVTRQDFQLTGGQFASLAFELMVCPALVVNLNKRLVDRTRIVPNTLSLVGDDEALRRRIDANLEYLHVAPIAPGANRGG